MRKILFLLGFFLPFLGIGGLNLWINPYCVIYCEDWHRHDLTSNPMERVMLAYNINHLRPKAVVLGSSRARPIDTNHPGWDTEPVLNLGIGASSLYEDRRYLEHAESIQHIKKMVVVVEYFLWHNFTRAPFSESRLRTLSQNNFIAARYFRLMQDVYTELFSSYSFSQTINKLYPSINKFLGRYSLLKYAPGASKSERAYYELDGVPLEELRNIIALAEERNIDTYVVIPPLPMEMWTTESSFIPEKYYQWQRDILSILDKEAYAKHGNRLPYWDFNDFNSITLPPLSNTRGDKKWNEWFSDQNHFNTIVGTMILNVVFRTCRDFCNVPADFGVELTENNIEQHINQLRSDLERYKQEHP